jgi:signal transduction histidine kinase
MIREWLTRQSGIAGWLVAAMSVSIAIITWFGYRAVREWQRSSLLLIERRTDEAAHLLVTALTDDMRAVQKSVLTSADWDVFMLDPPYDVGNVVASTFARYPYPECFFGAHGVLAPASVKFFTRSNRPPRWADSEEGAGRFPVRVQAYPVVAQRILERMSRDAITGRRFSVFELTIAGEPYQVVTRLLYATPMRDHPDGLFGFMVNLNWVRQHYFPELTGQVARIAEKNVGLSLAVLDERGLPIGGADPAAVGPTSRRSVPLMFFDPLLGGSSQQPVPARAPWTVQLAGLRDPTLVAAIRGSNRTLMVAALAASALVLALFMSMRAVRAAAGLAELRSEFVATVTHELKTPIATIRAIGDTLVSGRIATPAGQREYATLVVQEAKSLTRLIDNLLAMSRITDITEVYSFEPQPLDVMVDDALKGFEQRLETEKFRTEIEVPPDLPLINADRTAMGLLLDNLVDNAIRYSPATRYLHIGAHRQNGHVVLEVTDHGRGIPEDEIEHVTRKFFRGRHPVQHGGGLGLAIAKRIVNDHRGSLSIRSAVNVGTTVAVMLPISSEHEEAHSHR